jgi:hypothetical protein
MPKISRFFGIIIYMYAKDHLPPHFHAEYNGEEAMFAIETGEIIIGSLPKKPTRLVQAWVELYRDELMDNYNLLQQETGSFKKSNHYSNATPYSSDIVR